jgi:hypothetical protein
VGGWVSLRERERERALHKRIKQRHDHYQASGHSSRVSFRFADQTEAVGALSEKGEKDAPM